LIPGEIEVAIAKRWRPAHSDSRDRTGQAPAAAQQDEILRRVRAAQVEALYGSLVPGIALTPVVAAALVLLLWGSVPHTALLLWAGATLVPAAIRWRLRSAYLRSADSGAETERWLRSFLVLAALQSALLGSAAWFVFPQTDVIAQTALIVILSGVASGGVLTLLGHWPTAITHIAFVIVPLAVKFFFVPAFPVSFAPLAVVFGVVLAVVARDFSNMLVRSLRSQLEKERLNEDLSAAKREAEMANQEKMAQSAKVAEQRLQAAVDRETARSAAFLQTVLENTTEALVAFGEDGRLSLMNKQSHQITGLPANLCRVGASIGDVIRFLIEGSDVGDTEDGVNRVIDLTHPRHLRFFEYRSPGGRDIEVRMGPMPDGGVEIGRASCRERVWLKV
jgi:PAS domain-containing protein